MVFERIAGHLRLAQIGFLETVAVDDQDPVGLQIANIHLQCGRIHGDQHVDRVTRRVNFVRGKM